VNLETFLKYKGLHAAYISSNHGPVMDHFLRDPAVVDQLKLKRLQFDTHEGLYAEVENACALLDCSKREFLEHAVVEALNKVRIFFDTYKEATGQDYGEPMPAGEAEPLFIDFNPQEK